MVGSSSHSVYAKDICLSDNSERALSSRGDVAAHTVFGTTGKGITASQTTHELWNFAEKNMNSAWGLSSFRRRAANIKWNGFTILKNFSTYDGDYHFLTVTIKLPRILYQKSFRDLHQAILSTYLRHQEHMPSAELYRQFRGCFHGQSRRCPHENAVYDN